MIFNPQEEMSELSRKKEFPKVIHFKLQLSRTLAKKLALFLS